MKSKSKSKSDSSNSSPLKMNSLSNSMKEKKILIDRILDKLNENKLYTVAIAIFLELKANNYEATSTKIISQKIISDFITRKKQYLKNDKESGYYESDKQIEKAITASLTATNVFKKIKKGNETYVKFSFPEAEEYLKKIKNRQVNNFIRNELEQINKNPNNINNNSNKNTNAEKENKNKEKENNLSSMDLQDDNLKDDFSISIDSNFVGDEEKKFIGNKRENSFEEEGKNFLSNNENNLNMDNNLNSSFNNGGINLNAGFKKRRYNKQKKGLIGENKKKLKNIKNPNFESDSEEVKMLENYDIIHDNKPNSGNNQKRIIKHRRHRRHKRNQSNKMIKNNLEIDIQKIRGRPKKKFNMIGGNFYFKNKINNNLGNGFNKNYPFISINNKDKLIEGQNNLNGKEQNNKGGNNDKIIEIIEESSEEIKSRQINNYLEHLYSFNKLMDNTESSSINNINQTSNKTISGNNQDNNQKNNNGEESIKNISDKSLHIISKIKVLYEQMDKMEDNLDLLNNLFNQAPLSSTYNESEASPQKKDKIENNNKSLINNAFIQNNINDGKAEKLYKDMKKNETLLNVFYKNMELSLEILNNIYKCSNWNKNENLVVNNKKILKDYEKKYDEALDKFSRNLIEINELAFNNNALKIYENIKEIKEKLQKEKIAIGTLDDFFKKLENNFESENNKFFDVDNIKKICIDKKNKLLSSSPDK